MELRPEEITKLIREQIKNYEHRLEASETGIVVLENGVERYYEHDMLPNSCHGTGDIYASAFVGALVRGKDAYAATKIAADYTMECIKATAEEENHWYGAKFEPVLMKLIQALN